MFVLVLMEQSVRPGVPQVAKPVLHTQLPFTQLPLPLHGGLVEQLGEGADWK